uniref:Uncharacterized protein n=1 Tax=Magallana gigas TaxID=29159 RepID=K1QUR5_MAGGI
MASWLAYRNAKKWSRVRLDEILQKWCHYKGLLERDKQFFNEEFPVWVKDIDKSIPDNLHDAQCKLKTVREMWERLASMKQEHAMAASQCEYIGDSNDKQDDGSIGVEDSVSQLAEAVQEMVQDAIGETERRMNDIRDIIHQWETIDRTRNDLRNWLHSKQEDLHEIESRPSKLHPEAAELEIANLQVLREAVTAKGPEIDTFVNNYRDLTQHKPSLVDPVVRAVRDDWDELLGQIENLLEEREQALLESRELQDAQNTMDDDLEDFVKELEKIEAAEASLTDKVNQLKKRKCRSTQTPRDTSLKKGMLVDILTDVRTLKENGAHGETGTQTETEQSTQTGPRLFPEADPVRNARHGRLRELMDDVKELKSGNANSVAASPVADYRSQQTSAMGDPLEQSPLSNTVTPNRSSPIRFGATQPHATQDFQLPNSSITPNYGDIQYPGQRITMNDIHNINDRIQRLNNYQLPPRRTLPQPPPLPPPPPQFIVPVYASPPPRRVTFREFPRSFEDENDGFLSDESEYDGGIAPRRRRRRHTPTLERYGIEDALTEACSAAKQLRKMSQKMKDSLRDEFLHR